MKFTQKEMCKKASDSWLSVQHIVNVFYFL